MTPTPPETTKITCRNCNKQNVPNWKDGLCITCARDEVLGTPEPSTDPQDKQIDEIGRILRKLRAGKNADIEDDIAEAKKAIDLYTQSREREARIDELESLQKLHTRIYRQTVTGSSGEVYVEDNHAYISRYETQERLAQLNQPRKDNNET